MVDRIRQHLGNYRLLQLLGQGAFANVYLGEHIHLGTQAAIKVLQTQLASDDIETFRAEARTIAHLIHPHIVRVLEFGVEGETPYLVMDYAPQGTLRQKHPKGTRVPLATVVSYVTQLADALHYAHSEKLVHRDVKPENMLLGRRNEVLLSDFGIAMAAQSSRYQGTHDLAGTVAYMAPEQLQGKPRPASDQYALAVVVYEWLSGDRPFHGSFPEIAVQHAIATPELLRGRAPVSSAVEDVVMRGLAKDPKERFPDMHAFATALAQALQAEQDPTISLLLPPATELPTVRVQTPRGTSFQERILLTYRGHIDLVRDLQWSSDGKSLVSGGVDRAIHVWDALSGKSRVQYYKHTQDVISCVWSLSEKYIASVSLDKTMQLWSAQDGAPQTTYFKFRHKADTIVWSPNRTAFASAGTNDAEIKIWKTASDHALQNVFSYTAHRAGVHALAWSPDEQMVASADGLWAIHVWNSLSGKTLSTFEGRFQKRTERGVNALAWSPNGHLLASGGNDRAVHIWNARTGSGLHIYREHQKLVQTLAWSPDGHTLASASTDGALHVWDVGTGEQLFAISDHFTQITRIAWSPEGTRLAVASKEGLIQILKTQ